MNECEVCAPAGCTCVSPSQMRELASIISPAAERERDDLRALLRKVRDRISHDDGSSHPLDHALFDIQTMLIMADLGDGDNS